MSYVLAPRDRTMQEVAASKQVQKSFKPATEKQVGFLKSLLADRVMDDEHRHWLLCNIESNGLSSYQASQEIDALLKKPRLAKQNEKHVPKSEYKEAVEDAYYVDPEGVFFQVVRSKAGHLYAMELKPHGKKFKWVYSPGAMKNFQTWVLADLSVVAEFGKRWGHCMVCARLLTNPESIEAGIGPICAGKF